MEKSCRKRAQNLVLDPFLVLVKKPKQLLLTRNCDSMKEYYQKALKKFSSEKSLD